MNLKFNKLFKPMLIISAAVTLLGVLFLVLFSGGTFASFTLQNLRFSLFVKVIVTAVLVFAATLLYFLIRFKKKGFFLALFGALSAVVSAVVAFALCVVCRAPLGEYTFALMLLSVVLSYAVCVLFANNLTAKKVSRKKAAEPSEDNYSVAAELTWKSLRYFLAVICVVLVAALAACVVFAVRVVPMYALPAIITALFSVVQTIAVGCKLYASKA